MTEEEKQLVLKDLSARLPYNPHIWVKDGKTLIAADIVLNGTYINDWMTIPSCQNMTIKPYLRPMSSMTEEEINEFHKLRFIHVDYGLEPLQCVLSVNEIDWLNAHHFDYRGLIEKGLALEALEEMYNN